MRGSYVSNIDGTQFRFHSTMSMAVAEYSVRRHNAHLMLRLWEAGLWKPGESGQQAKAAWAEFNSKRLRT
jgi:hypothetical protein